MTGSQVIDLRTNNQAAIALSSGEAEYCSTVKILQHGERAEQAMGLKGVADDVGVTYEREILINADARAATRVGSRLGTQKLTHIEVNRLLLQVAVHLGTTRLQKV